MRNPREGRPLRTGVLGRAWRHSFTRFAVFGLLGLGVDVGLLAVLLALTPLPTSVAVSTALVVTYAANFALNRRFSFGAHGPLGRHLARFVPQVTVDWVLVLAGVEALTAVGVPVLPARILVAGTNAVFNYVTYRWWTFGRPSSIRSRRSGPA